MKTLDIYVEHSPVGDYVVSFREYVNGHGGEAEEVSTFSSHKRAVVEAKRLAKINLEGDEYASVTAIDDGDEILTYARPSLRHRIARGYAVGTSRPRFGSRGRKLGVEKIERAVSGRQWSGPKKAGVTRIQDQIRTPPVVHHPVYGKSFSRAIYDLYPDSWLLVDRDYNVWAAYPFENAAREMLASKRKAMPDIKGLKVLSRSAYYEALYKTQHRSRR